MAVVRDRNASPRPSRVRTMLGMRVAAPTCSIPTPPALAAARGPRFARAVASCWRIAMVKVHQAPGQAGRTPFAVCQQPRFLLDSTPPALRREGASLRSRCCILLADCHGESASSSRPSRAHVVRGMPTTALPARFQSPRPRREGRSTCYMPVPLDLRQAPGQAGRASFGGRQYRPSLFRHHSPRPRRREGASLRSHAWSHPGLSGGRLNPQSVKNPPCSTAPMPWPMA